MGSDLDPYEVKIFANSDEPNRVKWLKYRDGAGLSDSFFVAESAIKFLSAISICQFKTMCPDLVDKWHKRYSNFEFLSEGSTLHNFLQHMQINAPQELERIFGEFSNEATKYFSECVEQLLNAHQTHPERYSQYALFELAKYTISSFEDFGVHIE